MVQAPTLLIVIGNFFLLMFFCLTSYCLILGMNGRGRTNGTASLPLVLKKLLMKIIPTNIITTKLPESSTTDISLLTARLPTFSFFFTLLLLF